MIEQHRTDRYQVVAFPDRLGRPVYQVSDGGMLRPGYFARREDAEAFKARLDSGPT